MKDMQINIQWNESEEKYQKKLRELYEFIIKSQNEVDEVNETCISSDSHLKLH